MMSTRRREPLPTKGNKLFVNAKRLPPATPPSFDAVDGYQLARTARRAACDGGLRSAEADAIAVAAERIADRSVSPDDLVVRLGRAFRDLAAATTPARAPWIASHWTAFSPVLLLRACLRARSRRVA
jgi:hypothetical protein